MANMVLLAKDLMVFLFYVSICTMILYIIIDMLVSIYRKMFCNIQIKLYKTWKKRLKKYMDDSELEKVLNEIKLHSQKKF